MLKFNDSITLARTKFRTRRVRLILSLLVISLVCGVVCSAILAVEKSKKSLEKVSNFGLHGRYLASFHYFSSDNFNHYDAPPEIIAEAENLYKEDVAKKKAIAKKLDYEYVETEAENPIEKSDDGEKTLKIFTSEIAAKVWYNYLERQQKTSEFNYRKLLEEAKKYNPSKIIDEGYSILGGFNYIYEGKSFRAEGEKQTSDEKYLREKFEQTNFHVMNEDLTRAFRFKNYKLEKDEIPIFVDYKTATNILKLQPLKNDATDEQRYQRIMEIREKIKDAKIQLCYRNETAQTQLGEYQVAQKNPKTSQFEYANLGICENVQITKDKRTAEEKLEAKKEANFLAETGQAPEPAVTQLVNLRVVGISDNGFDNGIFTGLSSFLSTLVNSSLGGYPLYVDGGLLAENVQDVNVKTLFENKTPEKYTIKLFSTVNKVAILEFSNIDELRKIIKEKGCTEGGCGDIVAAPFGTQIMMIDEFSKVFGEILRYVLIGVVILTSIMIYVVVNRIMHDSRKETAVFRAIGFSQFDILQIYVSYLMIYSAIVAILTTGVVFMVEIVSRTIFEPKFNEFLMYLFALDDKPNFEIMRFSPIVLLIFVAIFAVGLIASSLPLIVNTRRSPLKNLRSE